MRIAEVTPKEGGTLYVVAEDGRSGSFDARPYLEAEAFSIYGVERVALRNLLEHADVVTLHTPHTEETHHLIGDRELARMKTTAFLVNTSRGKLVDGGALYRALKAGRIAGAALDVLEREPPDAGDPLLSLDSVVITPHLAYYSDESMIRLRSVTAESAVRVIKGQMPHSVVNREVLGKLKLEEQH